MQPLTGISITIMFLTILLIAEARSSRIWIRIAKPFASSGFIIAAIGFGAMDSLYGQLIFIALLFSFAGDLLLIPKSKKIFIAGIMSFSLAHIAFAAAFIMPGVSIAAVVIGTVIVAGIFIIIGRWLSPHLPANMRTPVRSYLVIIGAMASIATGCAFGEGPATVLIGAALFVVSDIAVARNRFVSPGFVNKIWGLPLYYSAQLILASTVGQV